MQQTLQLKQSLPGPEEQPKQAYLGRDQSNLTLKYSFFWFLFSKYSITQSYDESSTYRGKPSSYIIRTQA